MLRSQAPVHQRNQLSENDLYNDAAADISGDCVAVATA